MKRVLVPCDFSNTAVQAFKFGLDVVAQSGGVLQVLHVIELPVAYDTMIAPSLSFEEVYLKEARVRAQKTFLRMRDKFATEGQRVSLIVDYGQVVAAVERHIAEKKIDLVIMGTRGSSGIREILIGSNTEKIVRRSSVPVIAIKKFVPASSIRSIVFPNTLGQDQEELTLKVKELQNFFKADLHIVYVNTPSNFRSDGQTRPLLKAFAKRFMLKDFSIHVYNDVDYEPGIINFAHDIKADLIVMATHGRRGISHLLLGSIAEDVVNHIDCPIWTLAGKVEKKR